MAALTLTPGCKVRLIGDETELTYIGPYFLGNIYAVCVCQDVFYNANVATYKRTHDSSGVREALKHLKYTLKSDDAVIAFPKFKLLEPMAYNRHWISNTLVRMYGGA